MKARRNPGLTTLSKAAGMAALLTAVLTACGSAGSAAPSAAGPSGAGARPSAEAGASPAGSAGSAGADWSQVVDAANKEGAVTVWAVSGDARRAWLKGAFEKAYPNIKVDLYQAPSTAERGARFMSEYRAGVLKIDLLAGGSGDTNATLKPAGVLMPTASFLRPEVLDPKTWRGDKLTWADEPENKYLLMADTITDPMAVLNQSVDVSEVQSWDDLLKDKFTGKIVTTDPRTSGTGYAGATFMYYTPGLGPEYVKKLFPKRVVLSNDDRQNIEWTDQGRMLVNVYVQPSQVQALQKIGSKLKVVHVLTVNGQKKGAFLSNEGTVTFPKLDQLPHPNAARVFANWLYSKEGQQDMVNILSVGSLRKDADNSKLPDYSVPEEGIDNVMTNPWTAAEPTKAMRDYFNSIYTPA